MQWESLPRTSQQCLSTLEVDVPNIAAMRFCESGIRVSIPSHTIIPLNLRVRLPSGPSCLGSFESRKGDSDGVEKVQIQGLSPWTWIDVSSTYRIGALWIFLISHRIPIETASAARRVKSNIVARTYSQPKQSFIVSWIFLWGSLGMGSGANCWCK